MGPAFHAIPAPDTGTYPSGSGVPAVELLQYPFNSSATTPGNPLRARRPDINYGAGMFGTVAAATSTTVTLETAYTYDTGDYDGQTIEITGGTGIGQTRAMTWVSGRQYSVSAWTTTPDTASTYETNHVSNSVWEPVGSVGYWTLGDSCYSSAVWIDNGVKRGIVVFVNHVQGLQFYGPGGPHYQDGRYTVYLYDPDDFAAVAQSATTNYLVEPYETFDITFPFITSMGIDSLSSSENSGHYMGSATVNEEHNRVYVSVTRAWQDASRHPVIGAFDITS
jgi:hypothetical protein